MSMAPKNETYLGDGLYVSSDGYMFTLRAPRTGKDDFVYLEPEPLSAFLRYVEKVRGVEIKMIRRVVDESVIGAAEQERIDKWLTELSDE